jgi:hypothetical protein
MTEHSGYFAGTEPKLSTAEAVAAQQKKDQNLEPTDQVAYEDLPVVRFPIKFKLTGKHVDYTGEIGGVNFVNGATTNFQPHRRAIHIAGSFGPVVDLATGIEFSALGERRLYTVEGRNWNYGRPLPEHCLVQDAPAAATPPASPALSPAPVPAAAAPVVLDRARIDEIKKRLPALRPGHKEDWTTKGLPDANRLSELLGYRISIQERDRAWTEFNQRFEGDKSVFAIPQGDEIREVLRQVAAHKGRIYVRQIAETRGLKVGKDLEEVITALIDSGLTLEQARAL